NGICGGEPRIRRIEAGVAAASASDQDLVASRGAFHPVAEVVAEPVGADGHLPLLTVGPENGASGARTRDLLTAGQTLSQLSYGPRKGVIGRQVYRRSLAVPGSVDSERQPILTRHLLNAN